MKGALYLGIDLGTSGVRCAVVDEGGQQRAQAQIRYPQPTSPMADAQDWWDATAACLDLQMQNLQDAGLSPRDIRALAIDGTSGSMVLVDDAVRPVTPGLMYSSAGFEAEAALIAQYAEPGSITRGSNSALARMLRLQGLDSGRQARHLCHQADFIAACIMGQAGHSDDNNALKTGFDPETLNWPAWLESAGVRTELLPEVHRVGSIIGHPSPAICARFGFARDIAVRAGTTDSIAAFLASGANTIGDAVTSLGTTLAIKLLSRRRIDDQSRGLYSHRLGNDWLVGGASNTGGGVLLDFFTSEQIAALSVSIAADKLSGLDYYPLSRPGERFPVNDPKFLPRMTPRPISDVAFLHGLLEGIARIEAEAYAALVALGAPRPSRILTAGGGAQNQAWTTIRRRLVSPTIAAAHSSEAAFGMALLCRQSDDDPARSRDLDDEG